MKHVKKGRPQSKLPVFSLKNQVKELPISGFFSVSLPLMAWKGPSLGHLGAITSTTPAVDFKCVGQ